MLTEHPNSWGTIILASSGLKVFRFYVMIMFSEKGGIVFKGGRYMKEDIIQGNIVFYFRL